MTKSARIAPLGLEYEPANWPGTRRDEMRTAADGLPARVVKLHNDHKAHFIRQYAHTVAAAMSKKWGSLAFIDMFAGPGVCWVEDTGQFVKGSPLIAAEAAPQFTHLVLVDMDSECTSALEQRFASADTGATIICADSNETSTIEAVRTAIPRRGCLSLALLDPQGCNLHLDTIRRLTNDRSMDLLINLPIHSLYRCLRKGDWHVLSNVLGADWPKTASGGVPGWRAAIRAHYREQLAGMGYVYSSAKEVRSEEKKSPLYDFVLASRHPRAKEFAAGNLTKLTDPAKQTTTYTYDPGNRLKEVSYSDGKTPTAKYEYDADGDRSKMTDGTGTSNYTYDQLDRLTEDKDGHGDVVKSEYDLANDRTKLTYPNTKSVTSAYDKDGRLEKITDWSTNVTKFTYNPDSEQAATVFPTASKDEDKYAYNDADHMTEAKMVKGSETLASLVYTRDSDGQVKKTTVKKLPGAEVTENTYDESSRLTKSGTTAYEYDAANNATKLDTGAYKYDKADQLETGPSLTYTYDELGRRTKAKPTSDPATSYGYDQAGNLTSVERPAEGEVTKIEDSYRFDGGGLRTSQTISGTTSYLTWDRAEPLAVILSDGANSYIYGPGGTPSEQINNTTGAVTYLHHDQAGSTRLLTGSTGTGTGKCTYGAYGTPTCEGTTTTPLGYDGQLTSSDTGLIYLHARVYDPATAQFLSVDPMVAVTRAPYNYAGDNPLNHGDRSGLGEGEVELLCVWPFCAPPPSVTEGIEGVIKEGQEVAEGVWNEITGGGGTPRSLPREGEPNGTGVLDRGNGSGQIRDYGPNGEPRKDFDFGHTHGAGDPHVHDWEEGIRKPGRPLGPCD